MTTVSCSRWSVGLSLLALLAVTSSADAQNVRVNVNGTPVAFDGAQPTEYGGAVLVPLRGVFEAMGAYVEYDAANRTVYANKGDRKVILPLGANSATVNGQVATLSQPARVQQGTTLVPLRFVAESLGANVDWVAANSTLEIRSQGDRVASNPNSDGDRNPELDSDRNPPTRVFHKVTDAKVTGIVESVDLSDQPNEIIVRANGTEQSIPISQTASIWLARRGYTADRVDLKLLSPGDQVTIKNEDGVATRISATYDVISGKVARVDTLRDGRTSLLMDDGRSVMLVANPSVWAGQSSVDLSTLQPGDRVSVRINPNSSQGYTVAVNNRNGQDNGALPRWAQ